MAKDDTTSDYNSDEEVFSNTDNYSMDTAVSYNAILCHVTNRKIIDTVEVYVTNKKNSKIRSNFLSDGEDCPQASTSPSLSECQLSRSAPLTDQNQILSSKSVFFLFFIFLITEIVVAQYFIFISILVQPSIIRNKKLMF